MNKKVERKSDIHCEVCEIVVKVPTGFTLSKICPIDSEGHRLLIIFDSTEMQIVDIYQYLPSKKYIFRNPQNQVLLETHSIFYGC